MSLSIHTNIKSASVPLQMPVPQRSQVKSPLLTQAIFDKKEASKEKRAIRTIEPIKPSPREIFWGLGKDWWKQLYDGWTHPYGPTVFDEGLHGGRKERGYYRDAKIACAFAAHPNRITKNPTVSFYKKLHRIACSHFDGVSTLMTAKKTGRFISPIQHQMACNLDLVDMYQYRPKFFALIQNEFPKDLELIKPKMQAKIAHKRNELLVKNKAAVSQLDKKNKASFEIVKLVLDNAQAKMLTINAYILQKSRDLGLSHPIAKLCIDPEDPTIIKTVYLCTKEEVKHAVKFLFAEYDQKMKNAHSDEEKLRCIANLFQMLDWLHSFNDGQGRTDLILLAKELCHHGFNPAILDQPFFSTISTLDEWVEYLKQGMEKWRKCKAEMERASLN
jgi:hypothetical protein